MTAATCEIIGISNQRGFQLRYFLGAAMFGAILCSSSLIAAQVDCVDPAKVYVSRVKGQVFDFGGSPVAGATLTLSTSGKQPQQMKTDSTGRFDFKAPDGEYTLEGELGPLEARGIKLVVGKDLWSTVHTRSIDLILGLRWSFCSWATTNHSEFENIVRSNKKRIEESAQRHATQK